MQPIIDKVNSSSLRNSAKTDFITGILKDLERKLQKSIPQILQQPALLSHTIHETLAFDQTLRDRFAYTAPRGSEFNLGLAQVIVGNPEWFDAWLKMEKECKWKSGALINLFFSAANPTHAHFNSCCGTFQ